MNHSPWYVDQVASYERQRIRDDMKQIRLAQKAKKAQKLDAAASGSQPAALRVIRHATLAVTEAVLAMLA